MKEFNLQFIDLVTMGLLGLVRTMARLVDRKSSLD